MPTEHRTVVLNLTVRSEDVAEALEILQDAVADCPEARYQLSDREATVGESADFAENYPEDDE